MQAIAAYSAAIAALGSIGDYCRWLPCQALSFCVKHVASVSATKRISFEETSTARTDYTPAVHKWYAFLFIAHVAFSFRFRVINKELIMKLILIHILADVVIATAQSCTVAQTFSLTALK